MSSAVNSRLTFDAATIATAKVRREFSADNVAATNSCLTFDADTLAASQSCWECDAEFAEARTIERATGASCSVGEAASGASGAGGNAAPPWSDALAPRGTRNAMRGLSHADMRNPRLLAEEP
jgi:hypothetical protein